MTDPSGKRATILKRSLAVIAVVFAAMSPGCTPPANKGMPAPIPHADRVGLSVPGNGIVNLDGEPGYYGVTAHVVLYKNIPAGLKSILVNGELDIIIYGGSTDKFSDATEPLFSWTLTGGELALLAVRQYGIWGYGLQLKWKTPPRPGRVWIIARYRPPSGNAIYSSPAEQLMPVEAPKPR